MKKELLFFLFVAVTSQLSAQEYSGVLQEIEANNTTLNVLKERAETEKLANRTGIYLSNPEVEFNYLWGNPSSIGNRTDFSIKQAFDFPTAYNYRGKIAKLEDRNIDLNYKSERINLLLAAKRLCIELVYYNALIKEYEKRLEDATAIAQSYKQKLQIGETNQIDNNKVQMNLMTVKNELERLSIERGNILYELKRLNGNKEITLETSTFVLSPLPTNFEEWYAEAEAKNPVLQYVRGEIEISEKTVKLNRALGLPKFSAGYMSEKVVGEHFQGIAVGISIPLWENKNRIKHAKSAVETAKAVAEDTRMQFYNNLQRLFVNASHLQNAIMDYQTSLSTFNNGELLKKALDAGEISLLDYLMEIQFYYDAYEKAIAAERDFEITRAELSAVEL